MRQSIITRVHLTQAVIILIMNLRYTGLMCYDRKLEILEKSIMKDFEEIADKLEFDY